MLDGEVFLLCVDPGGEVEVSSCRARATRPNSRSAKGASLCRRGLYQPQAPARRRGDAAGPAAVCLVCLGRRQIRSEHLVDAHEFITALQKLVQKATEVIVEMIACALGACSHVHEQ